MATMSELERSERFEAKREHIRKQYLHSADRRPVSSAQGLHHIALMCSDVEQTVRFYQELLEFPLTEITENRDYRGSSHFFFDIGNRNLLAFFDFPGLDLGPYQEALGGLHHVSISVEPSRWQRLRDKLTAAGVELLEHGGVSMYFQDPDGTRLELIANPLGEMYGTKVL
jgi:catechol 2,3-dioxygenase-like lactoylglutathione lyase family enzyme